MVVPSFDRHYNLNNLVFRFTDEFLSTFCAKWLFSHGRQATFGLHKVDPSKPVYVVEGFFDHVGMEMMGIPNSVGLGSAFISYAHEKFLEGLDLVFVLDSDETGVKYSHRLRDEGRKVILLPDHHKDPYEFAVAGESIISYL